MENSTSHINRRRILSLVFITLLAALILVLFFTFTYAASGDSWPQRARLTAADGAMENYLGQSIAIDGDTVVVGAPYADVGGNEEQGAVYVFVKPGASWSDITHIARLTASDGAAFDYFGTSVAIEGDTIVVGANEADVGGNDNQGAAYVFVKPGASWSDTTHTAKLTASDGSVSDLLGHSVDIDGSTVVAGAYGADVGGDDYYGAVYVFVEPAGGWSDTTHTAKLTASGGAMYDCLGYSVAIDGDTVVAGANGSDSYEGAAYIFVEPVGGWNDITHTAKLTAADGAANNQLGLSVDINGDTVAAGAYMVDSKGAAYVFVEPVGGWSDITHTAKLTAADGYVYDLLGISVAIEGGTVVAGARGTDIDGNFNQGAAYTFVKPGASWSDMTHTAKLTAADGAAEDYLGQSVAIDGGTVVAGAPWVDISGNNNQGKAYVFSPSAAGDLDPSFDSDGKQTTAIGSEGDYARSVALQSDGKIVVGGSMFDAVEEEEFALVRYNTDGSLDTSFGGDGIVTTTISIQDNDYGFDVAIQPDGKIILAGYAFWTDFAVARYNSDGSLDTSFGGDGIVTTDFSGSQDRGFGVALQSDGKIVVVGTSFVGSAYQFALVRYNSDGSLDTTFGSGDGKVTIALGGHDEAAFGVAIQTDGKIIVAGKSDTGGQCYFALARFNSNGSLDTSFDGDGKLRTLLGDGNVGLDPLALQSDGKILVTGAVFNGSIYDVIVMRYNIDGSLDTGFDGDGKVITSFGSTSSLGESVAVQSNGKIVVAGFAGTDPHGEDDFAVIRYNSDGSLDTSFSSDGVTTTDFYGAGGDLGQSVAIQSDGRIVVAGTTFDTEGDFAVARYLGDAASPPDPPRLVIPADTAVISDNTPTLTWEASSSPGVTGYMLDLDSAASDVGNVTQHTTGILADGDHTWTVAAYDVSGTGLYTDTWTFTVDITPPDPPTLVSPANTAVISDTTPTLTWGASPSSDAAGYWLDFNGTVSDVGDVTGHTTAILADGTYTWTVATYDEATNSSIYTDTWSFTVDAPPDPPVLSSPADSVVISDTTPTLTWQASPSPDVAGYWLDLDGTVTNVGAVTQFTTSALPDGEYNWRVAAYDGLGSRSSYTAAWSFTVDTTPPSPPAMVSPANGAVTGDDTPMLSWQVSLSPDVVGYYLDFNGTVFDVGNTNRYTTTLLANGVYTWTVAAYDEAGWTSSYPADWSFTVDTSLQGTVTGVNPGANSHTAAANTNLTITVSDAVSQTSVTTRSITVHGGFQGFLDGGFHYSDIVFDPAKIFHPGELVDVSVTGGVIVGKQPVIPYVWQFRTAVGGGSGRFTDSGQTLDGVDNKGVALGDLDGDGDLDAILARSSEPNDVWLNDGQGVFTKTQGLGNANTSSVSLGDLDGDGDLDAFAVNYDSQANKVWLNDGMGAFTVTAQSLGSASSNDAALGDLDGDGDLDAFVSNNDANVVWLNDGTGTFTSTSQTLGNSSSSAVALGDLDGDGDLDAFVANNLSNKVWRNNGTGTFSSGWTQSQGLSDSRDVALGDLDGDGDLDALVASGYGIQVWKNDGTGSFSTGQSLTSAGSSGIALGDLDGDSDLDAFVTIRGTNYVLWNIGAGTFHIAQKLGNADSYDAALGDLDGDGDLDAFVANSGWPPVDAQKVRIWWNQLPVIPTSGGTVNPSQGVTITISGGTFTDTVVIDYVQQPITNTGSLQNVGVFYELDVTYQSNGQPAQLAAGQRYTITVTYDQADVPAGFNEANLALFYWDGSQWVKEPTSVVDTVQNTITATPNHFSLWGGLFVEYRIFIPLVLK